MFSFSLYIRGIVFSKQLEFRVTKDTKEKLKTSYENFKLLLLKKYGFFVFTPFLAKVIYRLLEK
jgi:hypothetical protein